MIRRDYCYSNQRPDICGKDFGVEFDSWYAEEIRKAKEEAWDECDQETLTHIETNGTQTENWPENHYRKETE